MAIHLRKTVMAWLALAALLPKLALAQNIGAEAASTGATSTANLDATSTSVGASTIASSSALPSHTDSAVSGQTSTQHDTSGFEAYYLVFVALVLAAVGVLASLLCWRLRRRKRRARRLIGDAAEQALERDRVEPRPRRTRIRAGWEEARRWHGAAVGGAGDVEGHEGLNEHGEAPPPYMPKEASEEPQIEGRDDGGNFEQPAVPLRALSREAIALKPPEYSRAGSLARQSGATARGEEWEQP